jgi:NAD(P)-dependent dehydrogenase (short-subunit alcohol dehydrogenase family)
MIQDLAGTVALITGGGSGIGRGTALALARVGVNVVVADLDASRAESVAGEANATAAGAGYPTRGFGIGFDVNSQSDFDAARDRLLAEFGRVDIVMNNVGVISAGPPEQIPLAEWERIVSTNLLSVVRSNAAFLPVLTAQGSGHIVNTASTAGLYAYAYERLPYSATKAGVIAISEALALYLKPQGVGITCLCPGPVSTNIAEMVTFTGPRTALRGPGLEAVSAEAVGEQVRQAISDDTFLLLTHPDEVHAILVERAQDPEGFLARQVEAATS